MKQELYFKNLTTPKGKIDIVLDTDAYNEIDDQFAISYMLKSTQKFCVKGICAAPFKNGKLYRLFPFFRSLTNSKPIHNIYENGSGRRYFWFLLPSKRKLTVNFSYQTSYYLFLSIIAHNLLLFDRTN